MQSKLHSPLLALLLAPLVAPAADRLLEAKLTRLDDRVRVEIGGQLFTEYRFAGVRKPCFFPVHAPDGTPLTVDGDGAFDPHHHSRWFTHGAVNDIIFWNERDETRGTIVCESVDYSAVASVAEIRSRNRWVGPGQIVHLTDESMIRLRGDATTRTIDYAITLHAPADRPAVLGDTKEGSMAIRLPLWMTPPHAIPARKIPHAGVGTIVNAEGIKNDAAWGKRSPWVDYHATKDGKTYGVAIFDHPTNPRHPTWWHVRTYGLFAANPFGQHDFEGLKNEPHKGDLTISAGGSVSFRWRIYFHFGDEKGAGIAQRSRQYAAPP